MQSGCWIRKASSRRPESGRLHPGLRLLIVAALLLMAVFAFRSPAVAQTPDLQQLFQQAAEAQQQKNYAVALKKYQEIIRQRPDMVAAHANLAIVLVSLQRFDEAIAEYRFALDRVPGNRALRLDLGLAYYKKGDFRGAGREFASLHWEDPENIQFATLLADCDVHLGRNDEAVALLTPLEKAHPDNLDIAWVLGRALIGAGKTREGLKRVQKVADQRHSVEAYQLAANLYLGLTYFDKARRDAEAVIRLNPRMSKAYVVLGMVADYSGDEEHAEQQFRKALSIDPKDLQARLQLASVLYNQRRLDEARQQLNRALSQDAGSSTAHLLLGRVERAQGNLQAALQNLKSAAQESPNWLAPHVDLVALYYALKQPAEGAKEKKIVNDLMAQERQSKDATKVILPRVPAP